MTYTTPSASESGELNLDRPEALAPCPMPDCGSDLVGTGRLPCGVDTVNCGHCGLSVPSTDDATATERWNRRATQPVAAPTAGDSMPPLPLTKAQYGLNSTLSFSANDMCQYARAALANRPAPTVSAGDAMVNAYLAAQRAEIHRQDHNPMQLPDARAACRAGLVAALTHQPAQEQAEPELWVQYIDGVKTQNVARDAKEKATVESIHRVMAPGTTMTWQAFFAAPQAPVAAAPDAPRTDLSKRIRTAATADVTLAQAKLLIGAAEEIEQAHAGANEALTAAARDVLAERQRQVEVGGWTPAHDDVYEDAELSRAAAAYALQGDHDFGPPTDWPWPKEWWKPRDERRNLIRAGALVLAEIERLDRAAIQAAQGEKA